MELGGLEPLPMVYDLRNERVRMPQNMIFSTKNTKKFWGGGEHKVKKYPNLKLQHHIKNVSESCVVHSLIIILDF